MTNTDIDIEKMNINIRTTNYDESMAFVNEVTQQIKEEVLPNLEKTLQTVHLPKGDLTLNKLTIDFNASSQSDWTKALAEKLAAEILNSSREEDLINENTSTSVIGKIIEKLGIHNHTLSSTQEHCINLAILIYFLEKGFLPASSPNNIIKSFAQLESKILASQEKFLFAESLIQYLDTSPIAKKRFIKQASKKQWLEILKNDALHIQFSQLFQLDKISITQLKLQIKALIQELEKNPSHSVFSFDALSKYLEERNVPTLTSIHQNNPIASKDLVALHYALLSFKSTITLDDTNLIRIDELLIQLSSLNYKFVGHFIKSKAIESSIEEIRDVSEIQKIKDALENEKSTTQHFRINNAGLVLLHPFFPALFNSFGFLSEKNEWNSPIDQARAIYLMNYIATGSFSASEDELLLHKIIIGFDLREVLPAYEEISEDWIETISEQLTREEEELLEAIQTNWPAMKNCTWSGLRNDFLTRTGDLTLNENMQHSLTIEPHSYDVLLPLKNWGISLIKFSWMESIVNVDWK